MSPSISTPARPRAVAEEKLKPLAAHADHVEGADDTDPLRQGCLDVQPPGVRHRGLIDDRRTLVSIAVAGEDDTIIRPGENFSKPLMRSQQGRIESVAVGSMSGHVADHVAEQVEAGIFGGGLARPELLLAVELLGSLAESRCLEVQDRIPSDSPSKSTNRTSEAAASQAVGRPGAYYARRIPSVSTGARSTGLAKEVAHRDRGRVPARIRVGL